MKNRSTAILVLLLCKCLSFTLPAPNALKSALYYGATLEGGDLSSTSKNKPHITFVDTSKVLSTVRQSPWTLEGLTANAVGLADIDHNEWLVLVVSGPSNNNNASDSMSSASLVHGGPLNKGVAVLFCSGTPDAFIKSESFPMLPWKEVVERLETLRPDEKLDFSKCSGSLQAYLDLRQEVVELQHVLRPSKRRSGGSGGRRKSISRKKRTKLTKQWIRSIEAAKPPKSDTNDSSEQTVLLQRQLEDCGKCQSVVIYPNKSPLLQQIKDQLIATRNSEPSSDIRFTTTEIKAPIDAWSLSSQVIEVKRKSEAKQKAGTVRLVVLSDTHGFEKQLFKLAQNTTEATDSGGVNYWKLPDADILIHCGDFWGSTRNVLDNFLAKQQHIPTKLVLRGNHDPTKYTFQSDTQYITKSTTMELDNGLILDLRPFRRSRTAQKQLPKVCDVLVTHEPPFGILDKTYRKERVGSIPLRHAVESSPSTPALWLCGHIHEGRGAIWYPFRKENDPTVIVNAANANPGRARCLITGPVVIDLVAKGA